MADLFPSPRLDRYAQDLLQQSFAEKPLQVSPDILAQYNPNATQLQVQAPAPPPQAIQQYQGLQPSRDRQEYFNLVQQRFNEIANMVGGMDVLVKTGNMERARQAAMEDIGNIYGEPPAIEKPQRPLQVNPIPGLDRVIVSGAGLPQSQIFETKSTQPMQVTPIQGTGKVAVYGGPFEAPTIVDAADVNKYTATPLLTESGEVVPGKMVVAGKVVDVPADTGSVSISPNMLLDQAKTDLDDLIGVMPTANETPEQAKVRKQKEARLASATGTSGNFYQMIANWGLPGESVGVREGLENVAAKIGAIGASLFKNQGSFSNEERQMIKAALTGLNLKGTDEQALRSVRNLQSTIQGILDNKARSTNQGQANPSQSSPPVPQPTQEGMTKRVFVPGKGFQ